jgi:hypothetical protein
MANSHENYARAVPASGIGGICKAREEEEVEAEEDLERLDVVRATSHLLEKCRVMLLYEYTPGR